MCDVWAFCTLIIICMVRILLDEGVRRLEMCDVWAFCTLMFTHIPSGGREEARDV